MVAQKTTKVVQNGSNGVRGGHGTRLVIASEETYMAEEGPPGTKLLGNPGGSEDHAYEGREKALEGNRLMQKLQVVQ